MKNRAERKEPVGRLELRANPTAKTASGRTRKLPIRRRDGDSEQKLLQSEKLAVTGFLAAQIAHDIRNPLSSIRMEAQLLRDKVEPGPNMDLLRAMLREIDRVEWVVKGLLELSSPGELRLESSDVNEVIQEVLEQLSLQLRHRKIETTTEPGVGLPRIELDVDRFKQGLLNVMLNAADSMTRAGQRLTVRTSLIQATETIRIEVIDEGSGIPEEIRSKIFDPFVSTKREGVGLGLVNSKSVVERHHGTIRLETGPGGVGTSAIIDLPVNMPDGSRTKSDTTTKEGNDG